MRAMSSKRALTNSKVQILHFIWCTVTVGDNARSRVGICFQLKLWELWQSQLDPPFRVATKNIRKSVTASDNRVKVPVANSPLLRISTDFLSVHFPIKFVEKLSRFLEFPPRMQQLLTTRLTLPRSMNFAILVKNVPDHAYRLNALAVFILMTMHCRALWQVHCIAQIKLLEKINSFVGSVYHRN